MTDRETALDSRRRPEDFDTPWKDALTRYLPEFMQFYFPDAHAAIDWRQPHRFLDQELAQVVRDAALGKRIADRLVEVATLGGDWQWVSVHIEVQGQDEVSFAERLFVYNYRLYDRHRRPVATLAVLADERPGWRPESFGYELFGCRHHLTFPMVKLLDYAPDLETLLADPNPFALVTAAHLLTQQTRGDAAARYAAKWRLTKLLYARDWDKQRILDLFAVIDWLLDLPPALEQQLWSALGELERNVNMPYVTSVQRIGREEGRQEGQREEARAILNKLLRRRFGELPAWAAARLNEAEAGQLEAWAERIFDVADVADLLGPERS